MRVRGTAERASSAAHLFVVVVYDIVKEAASLVRAHRRHRRLVPATAPLREVVVLRTAHGVHLITLELGLELWCGEGVRRVGGGDTSSPTSNSRLRARASSSARRCFFSFSSLRRSAIANLALGPMSERSICATGQGTNVTRRVMGTRAAVLVFTCVCLLATSDCERAALSRVLRGTLSRALRWPRR